MPSVRRGRWPTHDPMRTTALCECVTASAVRRKMRAYLEMSLTSGPAWSCWVLAQRSRRIGTHRTVIEAHKKWPARAANLVDSPFGADKHRFLVRPGSKTRCMRMALTTMSLLPHSVARGIVLGSDPSLVSSDCGSDPPDSVLSMT